MNQVRVRGTQSPGPTDTGMPEPSTDLIAQANTILQLCEELDATRQKVRAAEQTYRAAQRALTEAEQRRDHTRDLAGAVEAVATAKRAVTAAEQEIVEQRRRVPRIEAELDKLTGEFGPKVTSIMQPRRAQAAQKFRDAVKLAKEARDEFVSLGHCTGAEVLHALRLFIPDLETGSDLLYERSPPRPEFVVQWWPVRRALLESQLKYRDG